MKFGWVKLSKEARSYLEGCSREEVTKLVDKLITAYQHNDCVCSSLEFVANEYCEARKELADMQKQLADEELAVKSALMLAYISGTKRDEASTDNFIGSGLSETGAEAISKAAEYFLK